MRRAREHHWFSSVMWLSHSVDLPCLFLPSLSHCPADSRQSWQTCRGTSLDQMETANPQLNTEVTPVNQPLGREEAFSLLLFFSLSSSACWVFDVNCASQAPGLLSGRGLLAGLGVGGTEWTLLIGRGIIGKTHSSSCLPELTSFGPSWLKGMLPPPSQGDRCKKNPPLGLEGSQSTFPCSPLALLLSYWELPAPWLG